jgi:hypothetical protein
MGTTRWAATMALRQKIEAAMVKPTVGLLAWQRMESVNG